MTKEQFLAGTVFKYGYSVYRYADRDDDMSTVDGGFVHKNKFTPLGYEMWVDKIGTKGFTGYRYVMNKKVKLRINFDECRVEEGIE